MSSSPRTENQMTPLDSWGHSASEPCICFPNLKISNFDLFDLTLYLDSPKWALITRKPSPPYSTCKITHKTCATTLNLMFLCMVTFCDLTMVWSWPWPELFIKHSLSQFLSLSFKSIGESSFAQNVHKTANFGVSTTHNLKDPDVTFELTLTWHVTSFWKFRRCFRIERFRTPCRSPLCDQPFSSWQRASDTPPPLPPQSMEGGWIVDTTACNAVLKGLSHLVQSCLSYRSCMSKDSARSTGHVGRFQKILRSLQDINDFKF